MLFQCRARREGFELFDTFDKYLSAVLIKIEFIKITSFQGSFE